RRRLNETARARRRVSATTDPRFETTARRAETERKYNSMKKRMLTGALALGAAAALALTACSTDGGGDSAASEGGDKSITFGLFNWDEAIAVSNLWKVVLEDQGYEVTLSD